MNDLHQEIFDLKHRLGLVDSPTPADERDIQMFEDAEKRGEVFEELRKRNNGPKDPRSEFEEFKNKKTEAVREDFEDYRKERKSDARSEFEEYVGARK